MAIVTELGLPEFGYLADDLIGPATSAEFVAEGLEHRGVVFPPGTIVAVCAERANREQAGERYGAGPGDGESFTSR